VASAVEDAELPTSPEDLAAIRWAPRVNPNAIRRLYETDARGIVDEQQIDDVGYALYARCRSILRATEAHKGRVTCPRCEHVIERSTRAPTPAQDSGADSRAVAHARREEIVRCERCGWRVRWREFFKTYQDKHLVGGGAVEFHEEFVAQFERARGPREKMLAIDRLIHVFHWELKNNPVRSAARELIYARNYKELLIFLDTLTYGEQSTPGLRETKQAWNRKLVHQPWHRAMGFGEPGESG
jgi:hypothetical protein